MAEWGTGSFDLPLGTHVHYINGVSETEGKDFKDKTKTVKQFLWDVQYQEEGSEEWKSRKIWTKQSFLMWDRITAPHLIPTLMKMVRACGLACPQSKAEAEAWSEETLVGQYFRVKVEYDEESGENVEKFVPMEGVAPGPGGIGKGNQQQAPKPAAAPPAAPKSAPKAAAPKAPPPPPPAAADAAAVTGDDGYE